MRGTTAKKLRKAAEVWMKMDMRVTNFRQAYQTLKDRYKKRELDPYLLDIGNIIYKEKKSGN